MNICPIQNQDIRSQVQSPQKISFKNRIKAFYLERSVNKQYGMLCDFKNSGFVGECVQRTAALFENLFGRDSLPQEAMFTSFMKMFNQGKATIGMHCGSIHGLDSDGVYFNSDNSCFDTKNKLKFNEMTEKIVWWHPTGHYLQTFVHEFGHSAHFHHLCNRSNLDVMNELRNTKIPTILGRFIAKCKLGRYSATNMNEFMAERITKDICKNLNKNDNFTGKRTDLDYTHIFENKWNYRYSCPQAYLDYYTQQVWNGDKEEASEILEDMGRYLKKIEAEEALPLIKKFEQELPKESLLGIFAKRLLDLNKKITYKLNQCNDLDLHNGLL